MTNARKNNRKGFTLIELIAVIVILGILAAVAVPKYTDMSTAAKDAAADAMLAACQSALTMQFANNQIASATGTGTVSLITTATQLNAAMSPSPTDAGWTAGTDTLTKDGYTITLTAETSTTIGSVALTTD